jgi:hypothetical protein
MGQDMRRGKIAPDHPQRSIGQQYKLLKIARERLAELIRKACEKPKRRIPTRPTLGSKKRRLKAKKVMGEKKALRGRVDGEE